MNCLGKSCAHSWAHTEMSNSHCFHPHVVLNDKVSQIVTRWRFEKKTMPHIYRRHECLLHNASFVVECVSVCAFEIPLGPFILFPSPFLSEYKEGKKEEKKFDQRGNSTSW